MCGPMVEERTEELGNLVHEKYFDLNSSANKLHVLLWLSDQGV
jgi:hypothetical protein